MKMRSDNTAALQGLPTGRVFQIGFLYQTKGKRLVNLWPQELAEDSSGALNAQNSASTDKTNEADSAVATAYISSVLPEGLELSTLQELSHLILTTST